MIKLELAFKNQEFSGIVAGGFLMEDGEVIDYIKTLHARVKELEAELARQCDFARKAEIMSVRPNGLFCCPFCGGEGQYFCWDKLMERGIEGYSINCEDCEMESPIFSTLDLAGKWWNRRAT